VANYPYFHSLIDSLIKVIQKAIYNQELTRAIIIIWKISAIISALILISVLVMDRDFLLSKVPTCPSKLQNQECILCGSSRAFFEIKEFNFKAAYGLNKLSIFVFLGMLINTSIFLFYIIKNLKK